MVRELETLTGEKFGMDQEKWIAWWRRGSPGSPPDCPEKSAPKELSMVTTIALEVQTLDVPWSPLVGKSDASDAGGRR